LIGRVFLVALGALLLAWGAGESLIGLFGAEATGSVTSMRRQLGDRAEALPNRYAYSIGYAFRLPDGTRIEGTSQRIGDFFSPKLGQGSLVRVRYVPLFPRLSVMEWGIGSLIEALIVAAVGVVLIRLGWRPGRKVKRPVGRTGRRRRARRSAVRPVDNQGAEK